MDYVDDHTIGITAILGITYTGTYDDVKKLDQLVEAYNQEHPKMPSAFTWTARRAPWWPPSWTPTWSGTSA